MAEEKPKLLLPKFLTPELAQEAIDRVLNAMMPDLLGGRFKHPKCHIVVLVPVMLDESAEDYPNYPNMPLRPHVLREHSLGKEDGWQYDYANIAKCKGLQRWQDRNDDRTDCMPHLLFAGDTPFWGAVKRHGIVVACSGVQPYFDKMIAGMVADMIIALAYHAWMTSADKADDEMCFLSFPR